MLFVIAPGNGQYVIDARSLSIRTGSNLKFCLGSGAEIEKIGWGTGAASQILFEKRRIVGNP